MSAQETALAYVPKAQNRGRNSVTGNNATAVMSVKESISFLAVAVAVPTEINLGRINVTV